MLLVLGALFPAWGMAPGVARAGDVDFSRDVLPILSENCFPCHGPDAASRKADLRLDLKDDALRVEEPVIVPGKSDESELILRILSGDADEVMPPPKSNRKLTPRQIELLKRWVDEGAKWGTHWAFEPPSGPSRPRSGTNAGRRMRSTASSWPDSRRKGWSRRPRPTGRRSSAA